MVVFFIHSIVLFKLKVMQLKCILIDEKGNTRNFNLKLSSNNEDKNLNDFIVKALSISEDKRKLPFITYTSNKTKVFPKIKMDGNILTDAKIEAMKIDSE